MYGNALKWQLFRVGGHACVSTTVDENKGYGMNGPNSLWLRVSLRLRVKRAYTGLGDVSGPVEIDAEVAH